MDPDISYAPSTSILLRFSGPAHAKMFFPLDGTGRRAYSGLPLRWGVIRMGNSLRLHKAAFVRALLLPVLLALAWIIWGAASAGAASGDSDSFGSGSPVSGSLNAGSLATAPVAAIAQSAVSAPLASPVSQVATARKLLPVVPSLPAAPSVPAAVDQARVECRRHSSGHCGRRGQRGIDDGHLRDQRDGPRARQGRQPDKGRRRHHFVGATAACNACCARHSFAAASFRCRFPQCRSLSAVPSVPAPELPTPPVPGATPTTPVPHAGGISPDLAAPPQAASPSAVGPRTTAPRAGGSAGPATLAETAVPVMPAAGAGLPLAGTGLSLAELQMITPQVRELAGARPAAHRQHLGARHGYGYLQSFAVREGTQGNSSPGFEGSGAQAAEVTGDWDRTPLFAGVRVSDAAQHLPTSPAFDPGSSPD